MRAEWANRIFFVLVCAGLFVAVYIGINHLYGVSPPCGAAQGGCDEISKPKNSMFLGVPIAFYGAGAYLLLALMSFARGVLGPERSPRLGMAMWLVSAVGAAISIGLIIWGMRILNATCVWCIASASAMTLAFLVQTYGMLQSDHSSWKPLNYAAYVALFALAVGASVGFGKVSVAKFMAENTGVVPPGEEGNAEVLKQILGDQKRVYGNPDAPITIVEFSDLFCPTCASMHPWLKKQLDGPLKGGVRLVFRHFPIRQLHPHALDAAAAAEYIGENHPDKFWAFLDTMFFLHDEESADTIDRAAQVAGVPLEGLTEALNERTKLKPYLERVAQDMSDGLALAVQSTPHFFILLPEPTGGTKVLFATGGAIQDIVEGAEFQAALRRIR